MEIYAALFYSLLRELTPAYFFYVIFKDRLRVSRTLYWFGLCLLVLFEGTMVVKHDGVLPLAWQFINGFIMFPYGLLNCRESTLKKLLVLLLLGQQTFLCQTLALVIKDQGFLPIANSYALALALLLINIVFYPVITLTIEKYKAPFLDTDDEEILVSANILLLFNFAGTILLYDFNSPRTWSLFWGRFFSIMPAFLFIIILYYLAYERSRTRNLTKKKNYLDTLRETEKRYFEYIFESWQSSRRMRHDMRHVALLLKDYLSSKDYNNIRQILMDISNKTNIFQNKE